jgi:hypothetical protein
MATRILIGTPVLGGLVGMAYAESLFNLRGALDEHRIGCAFTFTSSSDLEMSRNHIASEAMAEGYTHLLFVDADMGFRPSAVLRMLAANRPVIGANYVRKKLDLIAMLDDARNADTQDPTWKRKVISRRMLFSADPLDSVSVQGGIARFNGIGMGVTLIETAALRRMVDELALEPRTPFREAMKFPLYGFFTRTTDPAGKLLSEDFSFCARWRACGGDIWALLDEPILHAGTYVYGGNYLDTLRDQTKK